MKDDAKFEKQELSKEEMISILGAEDVSLNLICPNCGSRNITATLSIPPMCMCNNCGHKWNTMDTGGGGAITCGVSCQPGCKKNCATGGKK